MAAVLVGQQPSTGHQSHCGMRRGKHGAPWTSEERHRAVRDGALLGAVAHVAGNGEGRVRRSREDD